MNFSISLFILFVIFGISNISYASTGEFSQEDCNADVHGPSNARCLAYIPVYKFDAAQKKCVQAVYGGCGPSKNNFATLEQCEAVAVPVCT